MKDWKRHVSHFGWSLESAKGNISALSLVSREIDKKYSSYTGDSAQTNEILMMKLHDFAIVPGVLKLHFSMSNLQH
jgi:hypothetical protein